MAASLSFMAASLFHGSCPHQVPSGCIMWQLPPFSISIVIDMALLSPFSGSRRTSRLIYGMLIGSGRALRQFIDVCVLCAEAQSMVHSLEAQPVWTGSRIAGVLALHDHWLMYSTLQKADTLALYNLASMAIIPAIKASKQLSMARRWSSG